MWALGRAPPGERARRLADADPRAASTQGDEHRAKHDLSSLRIFGSTGEPWNPEPYQWLSERGRRRARADHQHLRRHRGRRLLPDARTRSRRSRSARSAARRTAWTSTSSTREGKSGARRGRRAGLQAAVAGDDARDLGRPASATSRPTGRCTRTCGATATGRWSTRTATGSCSGAPTTRSTSPASGSDRPRSSRCWSRTRRCASRRWSACPTRPRARRSGASACAADGGRRRDSRRSSRELVANELGPPVQALAGRVRGGAAEDALGQDPAPRGARGRGRRGPGRHVDAPRTPRRSTDPRGARLSSALRS